MKINFKITNTLTKKKSNFVPLNPGHVSLYVCGITPYDYSHLGHGRASVNFDFLARLLNFLGYQTNYVRNYTDIDDKILVRAQKEGTDFRQVANKFIEAYQQDTNQLNCITPTIQPKVTEHIPQIIDFIKGLVDKGVAYVVGHDVYFDISKFKEYGKLSGRNLEDLQAGARVEPDERKKNPGDFALWKGNDQSLFWQSPWGYGRPGWHIECSVLAKTYLGKTIDIHGGGMDLIFPHHENELAQSEGLHSEPFSRYWLHNAFITINKEKMSKSLGNFVTLRDIFKQFDPMVLRYFFLQHHYTTPIDFGIDELNASKAAYKRLTNIFVETTTDGLNNQGVLKMAEQNEILSQMLSSLCDDMNSTKLIGIIFENLDQIKKDKNLASAVKFIVQNVLGLTLQPLKEETLEVTPEIENLLKQREQARNDKNWALADKIRDELTNLGYKPQDKKVS